MSQELATRPGLFDQDSTAIKRVDESLPAAPSMPRIEDVLIRAIDRGVDADSMGKLVELQLKVMAKNAEVAFNRAVQLFQSSCPNVLKNKTGQFQNTYASLDHIAAVIRPHLEANGLSFSFDADEADGRLTTVCRVHHVDGHSREARFVCAVDQSAKQLNSMQKSASAHSYGRRYALLSALGITTADEDDDGESIKPHEPPKHDANAPSATPRGDRITGSDVTEIVNGWKTRVALDANDKAACRSWISEYTGIDHDKALDPNHWTRADLEKCRVQLDKVPF